MAQRSVAKRLWYQFLHVTCRLAGVMVFRIRCFGREHVPRDGGVLVLSNHQSNFDPVLIGLACDRRLNYLARESLFKFAPFRWLIRSLDAIPIDREGTGLAGLKETLRRLKAGEMVLIFPEGTRTTDGELQELKPGFCAVARRGNAALVPVAIDGAWQAWPRTNKLPRPGVIRICFAPAITPAEIATLDDPTLLAEIHHRLTTTLTQARTSRERSL